MDKNNLNWKQVFSKEESITIDAKKGEYGAEDWTLEVRTKDGHTSMSRMQNVMLPDLAKKIRGINEYMDYAKEKECGMITIQKKDKAINLWLDIMASAYNNDFGISGDVGLLPLEKFNIKGMRVIPKPWLNPLQDGIIIHVANIWVGLYVEDPEIDKDNLKPMFRLSTYDAAKYNKTNAKQATVYMNLHPIKDMEIVRGLLEKAVAIYSPDLSGGYYYNDKANEVIT